MHLRRAVSVLPQARLLWRNSLWHLGSALEASGRNDQALLYTSRVIWPPGPIRSAAGSECLQKVNGTLDGLDGRLSGIQLCYANAVAQSGHNSVAGSPPPTDSP